MLVNNAGALRLSRLADLEAPTSPEVYAVPVGPVSPRPVAMRPLLSMSASGAVRPEVHAPRGP